MLLCLEFSGILVHREQRRLAYRTRFDLAETATDRAVHRQLSESQGMRLGLGWRAQGCTLLGAGRSCCTAAVHHTAVQVQRGCRVGMPGANRP